MYKINDWKLDINTQTIPRFKVWLGEHEAEILPLLDKDSELIRYRYGSIHSDMNVTEVIYTDKKGDVFARSGGASQHIDAFRQGRPYFKLKPHNDTEFLRIEGLLRSKTYECLIAHEEVADLHESLHYRRERHVQFKLKLVVIVSAFMVGFGLLGAVML